MGETGISLAVDTIHQRIGRALPSHYSQLRPWRSLRRDILRAIKGTLYPGFSDGYGTYDASAKEIINLIQQAENAMVMGLAANRPRVMAQATKPDLEAFAGKMERALNRYAQMMYLEEILQEIVRDAFSLVGIGKIYMADSVAVGFEQDYRMDPGKPFLQRVSLDNMTFDTTACSPAQSTFFADRYRVSYDQLMSDARFKKWRQRVENVQKSERDRESEKPAHLEGIDDFVWLSDVYVPSKNRVFTYLTDSAFNLLIEEPIAQMRWTGDECGPYYFLDFGTIPDEMLPSSPGQNALLLHQLTNTIYRKLEDQAQRQKQLTVGPSSQEKDLENIRDAQDGEYIPVNGGKDAIGQIRFDGPDQNLFGFFINAQGQFSRAAGNLDHKLGLKATTDTVGQESMIGAQVSRIEGYQQQQYVSFVRKVVKGIGKLLWEDNFTTILGHDQVPNTEFKVEDTWKGKLEPGSRQGEYSDYLLEIDPYSMPYRSPMEKLAFIKQEVQTWLPVMPLLMQMGIQPDIDAYFEAVAKYGDSPEVKKIFKSGQPPQLPEGGPSGGGGQAGGPKEYIHRGAGPQGQDPDAQAMSMFSSNTPQG